MKHNKIISIALFAVVVLMTAFFGCDNRTFEADEFRIEWVSAPDTLYSNVEAEVKVLVVNKKTNVPAPTQTVTFKVNKGVIEATAATNEFGVATAKFSHTLTTDTVEQAKVEAHIHKSQKIATINLMSHPGEFIIKKMEAIPNIQYNDYGRTTSRITAYVVDKQGIGVVGETVRFRAHLEGSPNTTYGRVTSSAITDSTGIARVTFSDNGDYNPILNAVIVATIDQSRAETEVTIRDASELEYDLHLSRNPIRIYADNNVSSSMVTARVRDHNQFPVPNVIVQFKASIGQITARVETDEMGIARTEFFDGGEEGTAIITAKVGDITKEVDIEVLPVPEVHSVTISPVPSVVSLEGIYPITATAIDSSGAGLVKGSIMVFEATRGGFQVGEDEGTAEVIYAETDDRGMATVRWGSGTTAGDTHFTAYILGREPRGTAETYIRPGEPERINLFSMVRLAGQQHWERMPAAIPVDFQAQNNAVRVFAQVTDLFDNPVQDGIPLLFETDLGTIHPIKSTETFTLNVKDPLTGVVQPRDYSGVAWSIFTLGAQAGTATITAMTRDEEISGVTTIRIESYDIQSISFVQQEEIYLDVRGVGGIESRLLIVELRDFSGNRVADPPAPELPPMVEFQILDDPAPAGVNINNQGFLAMVRSNNGEARASINSGSGSGTVRVRVRLQDDQTINATKSNIVIRSGLPETIGPFLADFDEGINVGGGVWRVQAGAVVKDIHGNECIDGTVVHFSLGPNPPPTTEIIGAGFVGNESDESEDGEPGVAFTHFYYHGRDTGKEVTIIARSGDKSGQITIRLPIQQPQLEVAPSVGVVRFHSAQGYPQDHYVEVVATLSDGQGNLLAGHEILLTATQGDIVRHGLAMGAYAGSLPRFIITHEGGVNYDRFQTIDPHREPAPAPPGPPQEWTPDGHRRPPHTLVSEPGKAYGCVKVYIHEIPLPVEEWFVQLDNQITVRLVGTDTIAQTSFTMIRYNPAFVPPFR